MDSYVIRATNFKDKSDPRMYLNFTYNVDGILRGYVLTPRLYVTVLGDAATHETKESAERERGYIRQVFPYLETTVEKVVDVKDDNGFSHREIIKE